MSASLEKQTDRWQEKKQSAFKAVPATGKKVKYLGKEFLVYPNTFWPFADSQPLVKNLRVKSGESVLDVGTGSGVIAIFACYKGASRVVALDVNPSAVRTARENAKRHGFAKTMKVKRSDLFKSVKGEQFDVITANLPFRDKPAPDVVARSQWDTGLKTNTQFFKEVGQHLKPGGRIYFAQANFGPIPKIKKMAKEAGFSVRTLATEAVDKAETKKFYAFELKKIAG